MNDNAKLWVQALRSGEYVQGQRMLHNTVNDTWCCLGVGCDLAHKNGVAVTRTSEGGCELFNSRPSTPPDEVRKWLGIDWCGGLFKANDGDGKTFAEIAALIESEPEGLFVTPRPE